jgi:hypothetical protein
VSVVVTRPVIVTARAETEQAAEEMIDRFMQAFGLSDNADVPDSPLTLSSGTVELNR